MYETTPSLYEEDVGGAVGAGCVAWATRTGSALVVAAGRWPSPQSPRAQRNPRPAALVTPSAAVTAIQPRPLNCHAPRLLMRHLFPVNVCTLSPGGQTI